MNRRYFIKGSLLALAGLALSQVPEIKKPIICGIDKGTKDSEGLVLYMNKLYQNIKKRAKEWTINEVPDKAYTKYSYDDYLKYYREMAFKKTERQLAIDKYLSNLDCPMDFRIYNPLHPNLDSNNEFEGLSCLVREGHIDV